METNYIVKLKSICPDKRGRDIVILLIVGLLVYFVNIGTLPLSHSEGRWGEIAREMELADNWITPTINGQIYWDKPVLSYWAILGVKRIIGSQQLNEWIIRFPTVLASFLIPFLIYKLVSLFLDCGIGLTSALVTLTSFQMYHIGRVASSDMLSLLLFLIILWIYFKNAHENQVFWWLLVGFTIGINCHIKGLIGGLPLLVILCHRVFSIGLKSLSWRFLFHITAGAAMAGATYFGLWFWILGDILNTINGIYIYLVTGSDNGLPLPLRMVIQENLKRVAVPLDHKNPPWIYLEAPFTFLFPWSIFLPGALITWWRDIKIKHKREPFGIWFFSLLIFFSLMSSRREYYLLPAIPAAAVLIANHIHLLIRCGETAEISVNSRKRGVFIYGLLLTCLVFILGALIIFVSGSVPERLNSAYLYPSGVVAFVIGGVLLVVATKKRFSAIINVFTAFLIFLIITVNLSLPNIGNNSTFREFTKTVNEKTGNKRVVLFMVGNAKLIYGLENPPYPCIPSDVNASKEESVRQLTKETVPGDFVLLEKRNLYLLSSLNYELILEEQPNPSYVKVEWKSGPKIVPDTKRIKRKTLMLLRILNHDV
ncbi:MAG: glycosyltransferase family 39 protein [Candidatus Scalindua rubra]|uniref:Putative glycosyltransferase n=1 Tax=Candidatus Scalindua brodae TaxID=237368 RepID=A0A0B0EGN7_9BACT|nr:MAG: putative glycosyltransferase [Candidatus Scalindua brodae]MBZ0107164.1 glycosyltransferase family 39 protein [Candidatus Scalindua rubra]TWU38066.1 Undecaprenyl phosphate-alpha-4-amino-4-deoxy-L-arabinose arabinosyl transferase [Candidatus Brocadiaceae bacterium S225]